jgi:hypothetical protein
MASTNWDLTAILRNRYAFYSRLSRDSENLKAGHFYSAVTSYRRIGPLEAHTRLPYFASILYALSKGCNKIRKCMYSVMKNTKLSTSSLQFIRLTYDLFTKGHHQFKHTRDVR